MHSEYSYKIFDAHCDTISRILDCGGNIKKNSYNIDIVRMKKYEEYTQIFACFIDPCYRKDAMGRFEAFLECYRKQQFDGIKSILSVEGADMVKKIEDIDYLHSCGVRCIAPTWNGSNLIAGGANDPQQGLTDFGKEAIRRMNNLKIIIDVSHLNDISFYDIAKINKGTLIATHSNSRVVCNHRRNLTDEMFKIIQETGGCAGLNLYPAFLTEKNKCTSDDVLRHIEHWLNLNGENSIGLGSDFDGTEDLLPGDIMGAEDLHILMEKTEREFGKEITKKISYKNMKRVFGE